MSLTGESPNLDLSVVIPFFNEADSIAAMHNSLRLALDPTGLNYELIFVDDGSDDQTFEIASLLARDNADLKVIKLRCNAGQTPAMMAGIHSAKGAIIVTMDGDLQNDPMDIPMFVDKINDGYDIVVGWRHKRQDNLITRRIPSTVANWLIGKVTGVPIKDNGCSLKAYRHQIVKSVPLYSEMHRFIPAMLSLTGMRLAELQVRHHARRFGQSKYGLSRIYKVLLDLVTVKTIITSISHPVLWFAWFAVAHLIVTLFVVVAGLTISDVSPTILYSIALVTASSGIFLIACGVLSELIYRTGNVRIDEVVQLARVSRK